MEDGASRLASFDTQTAVWRIRVFHSLVTMAFRTLMAWLLNSHSQGKVDTASNTTIAMGRPCKAISCTWEAEGVVWPQQLRE